MPSIIQKSVTVSDRGGKVLSTSTSVLPLALAGLKCLTVISDGTWTLNTNRIQSPGYRIAPLALNKEDERRDRQKDSDNVQSGQSIMERRRRKK